MQTYEDDIVAWANEQARLLREGQFDRLDIAHIAEEIEDVGESEQRELARRMAVLLAHLLKWRYQPERCDPSWEITIRNQRNGVRRRLAKTPSLTADLADAEWWDDATIQAIQETGLTGFPEHCPCRSWIRDSDPIDTTAASAAPTSCTARMLGWSRTTPRSPG